MQSSASAPPILLGSHSPPLGFFLRVTIAAVLVSLIKEFGVVFHNRQCRAVGLDILYLVCSVTRASHKANEVTVFARAQLAEKRDK